MSQSVNPYTLFELKKSKLIDEVKAAAREGVSLGLKKSSSNLFRYRAEGKKKKIDVKNFNQVLSVDSKSLVVDVEGMTTYEELVHETLKYNCMPTVVPQLKTITIGGAVTGVGIESSSFKFGLVHETILEMEILLPDGSIVIATPKNEYRDLFYGFPNSYGTLGYALRLKVKLVLVKPFVRLEYHKFTDSETYFAELGAMCLKARVDNSLDFVDGVIFNEKDLYVVTANFVDSAPYTSNYTYMNIFYQTIPKRSQDFLTVHDYIWRWDTDWFWCSKHFGVQNKVLRFFAKPFLNSRSYWKIRRFASQILPKNDKKESVVQDVELPLKNCSTFLRFFLETIPIRPIWVCPTMAVDPKVKYDLYPMDPLTLYINFGFWDVMPTTFEEGHYNRLIELKVSQLNGKKSLYSTSYYPEDEFWRLYNKPVYDALKKKYDPKGIQKNLYEKCVKRG